MPTLLTAPPLRTIKSFVKRNRGEKKLRSSALFQELMGKYRYKGEIFNDFSFMDIGFGDAASLLSLCRNHKTISLLAMEVYLPGIWNILKAVHKEQLSNIFCLEQDAVEALKSVVPDKTFDLISVLFPDPWPKKGHHKRRLLSQTTIHLIMTKLKPQGILFIRTDDAHYARSINETIKKSPGLIEANADPTAVWFRGAYPMTKYHQKALAKNAPIFEFVIKSAPYTEHQELL